MNYIVICSVVAIIVVFVLILNNLLYQYQKRKVQHVNQTHNNNVISDTLLLIDKLEEWNSIIETKEGARDLLAVLNEICVNVFDTKLNVNITQDEFNRMSMNQTKASIQLVLDQLRDKLSSQLVDHAIDLQ